MKRPIQKEHGAILVMAAFMLIILMGIAAFALDLGRLYVLHTEMQNAVDAAVLSAAAELDGEAGAFEDAKKAANQEMLNHLAHFSKQGMLLERLKDEVHATDPDDLEPRTFAFYSWIGSSMDPEDPPSGCTPPTAGPTKGKCLTTSFDNAHYVQITLDPTLLVNDDGRYEIDLYFLPILSLLTDDLVATIASTRVVALAGAHDSVCDYPPVYICGDPFLDDLGEVTLIPGQQVIFHGSGNPDIEGGFGWLMPGYSEDDKFDDDLGPNSPELFHRRLGAKYPLECGPPIVKLNNGNMSNPAGDAINTRFGLFPQDFKFHYPENEDSYPSAPNVIDYPRDSDLMFDADADGVDCEKLLDVDLGNGDWGDSQCITSPDIQPSTFTRTNYEDYFHTTTPSFPGGADGDELRYDYYQQELLSGLPVPQMAMSDIHGSECQCDITGQSKTDWQPPQCINKNCRMLAGQPNTYPNPDTLPELYVGTDDSYKRRELFLAMIDCEEVDFGASNPVVDLGTASTKWARFFLTEHVGNPSAPEIYTEFIEEVVKSEDDAHFKKVIQLYE